MFFSGKKFPFFDLTDNVSLSREGIMSSVALTGGLSTGVQERGIFEFQTPKRQTTKQYVYLMTSLVLSFW